MNGESLDPGAQPVPPSPETPRHPSLEKTDVTLRPLAVPPSATTQSPPSDAAVLREQLDRKIQECLGLARSANELKSQLQALRSDFSVRRSDHEVEIRTLNEVIRKAQAQAASLAEDIAALKSDNKLLKSQNLTLQYSLNFWGIPVASADGSRADPETGVLDGSFFPPLSPMVPDEDPIPVALRGELGPLYFPDIVHFIANSNLIGVLTVVTDRIVSKLYLEKAILRLAGWNNTDPDLGLLTLLEEAELVPREQLARFKEEDLYDLELGAIVIGEGIAQAATIQSGLREHARVILSYLLPLQRGSFFFQPGRVVRRRELQFRLSITDLLLKTAAAVDEKTRNLEGTAT